MNLKSTAHTTALAGRIKATQAEIAELEKKLVEAQTLWQAAIEGGDIKGETAAQKEATSAQQALELAKSRLPIIVGALERHRLEVLPEVAAEVAGLLADINQQAIPLAREFGEQYGAAVETADRILEMEAEHSRIVHAYRFIRDHARPGEIPPNVLIPHNRRFAAKTGEILERVAPDMPPNRNRGPLATGFVQEGVDNV